LLDTQGRPGHHDGFWAQAEPRMPGRGALVIQVLGHLEPPRNIDIAGRVWFKWGWTRGECLPGKADDPEQLPP
jgi:hypothetical protein